MRRLLLVLGLGAAALVAPPVGQVGPAEAASACPAGEACVVVHLQGSAATEVVTAGQIDDWHDQQPTEYRIRTASGREPSVVGVNAALSIRELVSRLAAEPGGPFEGVAVSALRLATVGFPDSSRLVTLAPPAFGPAGSNGYESGLMPVVRTLGGTDAVGFVRPLTSDPDDVNGADLVQTSSRGVLDLTLSTTGSVLRPTITSTPEEAQAGEPVSFSVTVPSSPSGLAYDWRFDGGGSSTEQSPDHTWAQRGTYAATVTVSAPDGSVGQTTAVVAVGARPTPSASPSASTGPGGSNTSTEAPSRGPDDKSEGKTVGGKVRPSPTSTPSVAPSAIATPGTVPGTVGDTGTITGGEVVTPAPGVPSAPPEPPDPPVVVGSADEVTGLLLSSAAGAQPVPTTADPVDTTAPSARESSEHHPVDVLVWWALAMPVLLLLGAMGERRPAGALRGRLRRLRP